MAPSSASSTLPTSYSLARYTYASPSTDGAWLIYPRRNGLYVVCDPAVCHLKIVWAVELLAEIDVIADVKHSNDCFVVGRLPVLAVKYAGGLKRLQLRFQRVEDYESVVRYLEGWGVEVRKDATAMQMGSVSSQSSWMGQQQMGRARTQFGVEKWNHAAMEQQRAMGGETQIESTAQGQQVVRQAQTSVSTYDHPPGTFQQPHQQQNLQSNRPISHQEGLLSSQGPHQQYFQSNQPISHHEGLLSSQQPHQQYFQSNHTISRHNPRHSYQEGLPSSQQPHQQHNLPPNQQHNLPPNQPIPRQEGLPSSQHPQQPVGMDPVFSPVQQISDRSYQHQQVSEHPYQLPEKTQSQKQQNQMHTLQNHALEHSDGQHHFGMQDSSQSTRMQFLPPRTSSSGLAQPYQSECRQTFSSQTSHITQHAYQPQPQLHSPFHATSSLDDDGVPPPRLPISFSQRKMETVDMHELLALPPLEKPTIVPRPQRLLTPEVTPPRKKRAPAKPRAKSKGKGMSTEKDNNGDKKTDDKEAAVSSTAKKQAKPRARPKPKAKVVEAEGLNVFQWVVGDKAEAEGINLVTGIVSTKAKDGDAGEKEKEVAVIVEEVKKPTKSRAKPKPKAKVVEAEGMNAETGIVDDKAEDRDGGEKENILAVTVKEAKKPTKPRARPKPKAKAAEKQVEGDVIEKNSVDCGGTTSNKTLPPSRPLAKPKSNTAVENLVHNDKPQDETPTTGPEEKSLAHEHNHSSSAPVHPQEKPSFASDPIGNPLSTVNSPRENKKRGPPPDEDLQSNTPQKKRISEFPATEPPTPLRDGEDSVSPTIQLETLPQDQGVSATQSIPSGANIPAISEIMEGQPLGPLVGVESLDPRLHTLMNISTIFQDVARRLDFANISEPEQNMTMELLISSSLIDPGFLRMFQAIARVCQNPDFVERMLVLAAVSSEWNDSEPV